MATLNKKPAVFFDRDGVLIKTNVVDGKPYAIKSVNELELLPGALSLVNSFQNDGYKVVIVTNQPDVGNGKTPKDNVLAMHDLLEKLLPIDLIKACYHKQTENCACRKPKPGMLLEAASELAIDLDKSIMIGDRNSDVEAGKNAGCFTIFIDYAYNAPLNSSPDLIVSSLTEIDVNQLRVVEEK